MKLFRKTIMVIVALFLMLCWNNVLQARTHRSCQVELYMNSIQIQFGNSWSDVYPHQVFNAGSMNFRASAPAGSPNKARMRASKRAEACIDHWWNGRCLEATSTSFGEDHGNINIRTLVAREVCEDIRAKGRTELLGRVIRGRVYARILGNRCCRDSSKNCPYDYGRYDHSPGILDRLSVGGTELWPMVYHYAECEAD